MNKICPTCKNEYDDGGNSWKKVCYECYKNFKNYKRIEPFGYKSDIYITHPNVNKEELDEWIKKNGKEIGWGAVKVEPAKFRGQIWVNSTNYD